jgi:hypothetical protein
VAKSSAHDIRLPAADLFDEGIDETFVGGTVARCAIRDFAQPPSTTPASAILPSTEPCFISASSAGIEPDAERWIH